MVYKKIGDKIPSLSSLLLAGVLLAGGCQSNKKESAGSEEPKADKADKADKVDNLSKPLFAGETLGQAKGIYSFLLEHQGLEFLNSKELPLSVIEDNQLTDKPKKLKELVMGLYKSMTGNRLKAYPSSLQNGLKSLQQVSSAINEKNYYGYITALNEINSVFGEFSAIGKKMIEKISSGISQKDIEELKIDVAKLYSRVHPSSGAPIFTEDKEFCNVKEPKMLTGDQLARFLTGTEKDGSQKKLDRTWGVPALLDRKQSLYISIVKSDSKRISGDIQSVAIRGAQIGNANNKTGPIVGLSHKDKASQNMLPFIAAVRGDGNDKLINYLQLDGKGTFDNTQETPPLTGIIKKELDGRQFLFSLFKGNAKGDFLSLQCGPNNAYVNLKGDNQRFQEVLEQAKGTEEAFAAFLGNHINENSDLKDIFFIPSKNNVEGILLSGILSNPEEDDEANSIIVTVAQSADENTVLSAIAQGSLSDKLIINILRQFHCTSSSIKDNNQKLDTGVQSLITRVRSIVNNPQLAQSNLSFEQKLGAIILDGLFKDPTILTNSGQKTAKALMKKVHAGILKELNAAIVIKDGSKYTSTYVTQFIKKLIEEIGQALAAKHSGSKVTYGALQKGDFKIKDVLDAFDTAHKNLNAILSADVSGFLSSKSEEVSHGAFFPDIQLIPDDRKQLDEIRLGYLKNNKAQSTDANKTPAA